MDDDYRFSLEPVAVPRVETPHRRIVTKLPVPESLPLLDTIARYESSNVKDFPPVIWSRAEDYFIEDSWGNRWIDMTSTIFVSNAGHANPIVQARVREALEKPIMHSYCYPTEERARYLAKLGETMPAYLEKFSLYSAGTEATERALKLIRLHGQTVSPTKKVVVTGVGNYHGKTMGAQFLSGKPDEKEWIGYHDPGIVHIPFPYPWTASGGAGGNMSGRERFHQDIKDLAEKGIDPADIAGFLIESFQGWGAIFYPEDYIQAMAAFARENRALMACDEIQAGFGRTGTLFAYEHYGIEPDIVCCGKAVSTSLPLSIVMARGHIIDLDPAYTSTHGGHPMACAAGLGTLEAFEKLGLVSEAARKEAIFTEAFDAMRAAFPDVVTQTMGRGMVHAIFIEDPNADPSLPYRQRLDAVLTDRIVEAAMRAGVFLVRTGCGTIKLGPPLTIPDDALAEALQVTHDAIGACLGQG